MLFINNQWRSTMTNTNNVFTGILLFGLLIVCAIETAARLIG